MASFKDGGAYQSKPSGRTGDKHVSRSISTMTFCYKRHTQAQLLLACAFAFMRASIAYADPNASSASSSTEQLDSSNYNDSDFTRPETSAILRFEFRKSSTNTSETDR
jgi:hypothetical protein